MIVNVKEFGATGDSITDDHAAIQEAFNHAVSQTQSGNHGLVLYFPSGFYRISQPILWQGSSHSFLKLRILGDGLDQSIIFGESPWKDIFRFEQTGKGYTAYLVFEQLQFYYGRHAVYADNLSYSEFDHVRFRGNGKGGSGGPSLQLNGNTVLAQIRDSHFVHGGDVLDVENGSVNMYGCTIGEDVGNIRVRGSFSATSNYWSGAGSNIKEPNGHLGMGGAFVTVDGESRALFTGNSISAISRAFINLDNGSAEMLNNDVFLVGGTLIRTRRLFNEHGASIVGGRIRARGQGNKIFEGVHGYEPSKCMIDGTRFRVDQDSSIDVGLDPLKENRVGFLPGI